MVKSLIDEVKPMAVTMEGPTDGAKICVHSEKFTWGGEKGEELEDRSTSTEESNEEAHPNA